jgi:hypothetical protein
MPVVSSAQGTPSNLGDVLLQIQQAFSAMGDKTPIQIGKAYRSDFGAGSGPKVLLVPEEHGGIGHSFMMGRAAQFTHSCDVYVRAPEVKPDAARFQKLYALADRVIGCISVACTGKLDWGPAKDDSPTKTGEPGLSFSFSYHRDVLHDEARWSLPPADDSTAGARPNPPPGTPADGVTLDAKATPKE